MSILWQPMSYFLVSPGNRHQWHGLNEDVEVLYFTRNDTNILVYFLQQISTKGLIMCAIGLSNGLCWH